MDGIKYSFDVLNNRLVDVLRGKLLSLNPSDPNIGERTSMRSMIRAHKKSICPEPINLGTCFPHNDCNLRYMSTSLSLSALEFFQASQTFATTIVSTGKRCNEKRFCAEFISVNPRLEDDFSGFRVRLQNVMSVL